MSKGARLPGLSGEAPPETRGAAWLESKLWDAGEAIRGPVHRGQMKDWLTPLLFLRRLCRVHEEGGGGPVVPEDCRWETLASAPPGKVGERIAAAMAGIEAANPELDGFFSGFEGARWTAGIVPDDRLAALVERMSALRLGNADCTSDVMGDAYEALVKRLADDSPKDAGEYYTPRSVVGLMARLLDPKPGESVYDPACGTGGMLIGVLNHMRRLGLECGPLRGQEVNRTSSAIARANLFLHGAGDHRIALGDTLRAPAFAEDGRLETFDLVVANPPFSLKRWGAKEFSSDPWGRAAWGVPTDNNADFAWIQHMVKSMRPGTGRMAVVMPGGALFRGNREGEIRRRMIESGKLRLVAELPQGIFHSTGVATCVLGLADEPRKEVRFVDATGIYSKTRGLNVLTDGQIDEIHALCAGADDVPGNAATVPVAAIGDHFLPWSLSPRHYVRSDAGRASDAGVSTDGSGNNRGNGPVRPLIEVQNDVIHGLIDITTRQAKLLTLLTEGKFGLGPEPPDDGAD